jgi:DNA-directed RNA polymerase specialized sigma24 family protein
MEEVDFLLQRLESEWDSVVSEVNSYLSEGKFAAEQLWAIYQKHLEVIRGWGRRECKSHNGSIDAALLGLRRPLISSIVWDLWKNLEALPQLTKQELLAGLWERCQDEINHQAVEVAKKSRNLGSVAERTDELKQSFFPKFEVLISQYEPRESRLTTYLKIPAFHFFLNRLKSDDRPRKVLKKYQEEVFVPGEDVTETVDWFSSDQVEKLEWIDRALVSMEESKVFSKEKLEAFRLRFVAGKRVEDVAAEMGRSIGFVSNSARLVHAELRRLSRQSQLEGGFYE